MNVTYLGPAGATFTAIAYDKLAALYGAPTSTDSSVRLSLARANEDVLPLLLVDGGFGAIAMETKAEGRVDPPINSFIELLRMYDKNCPVQVIGALRMKIRFALMAQNRISMSDLKTVIAHPKALGACRNALKKLGVAVVESTSNGKAAEDVSLAGSPARVAALGPIQAAQKYGLNVLAHSFEDKEAVTTFFLLGPQSHPITSAPYQRCLTVFRVKHEPGALVKVLTPFSENGINLRLVHSLHVENGVYDFGIETESIHDSLIAHEKAVSCAKYHMDRSIQFGPFPVISE